MRTVVLTVLLLAGMLLFCGCTQRAGPTPQPGGNDLPPAPPDGSPIGAAGANASGAGAGGEAPPPPPG